MTRNYRFEWYKNERYGEPLKRHTFITVSPATGKVEKDGKRAVELFIAAFGGLKYNTIVKIQELDEEMNQIGEDIVPQEGSVIVPTAR
jgi:hypothetical protein